MKQITDSVILANRPLDAFFIDPAHVINGFQAVGAAVCGENPEAFAHAAWDEFDRRVDLLRSKGIPVLDIQSRAGKTSYQVYVRDYGAEIGGKFVLARLRWDERKGEEEGLRRIIRPECLYELKNAQATMEGGDCRETPFGITLLGLSPRTNQAAHEELKEAFPEANIRTLVLKDAHIANRGTKNFHLDVSLKFFPNGDLIIYRGSFEEASYREAVALARSHGGDVYHLSEAQMLAFSANIKNISVGGRDEFLTTSLDPDLAAWMDRRGHVFHPTRLTTFNHAGGGDNCLFHEVPRHMLTGRALGMLARQTNDARPKLSFKQHPEGLER